MPYIDMIAINLYVPSYIGSSTDKQYTDMHFNNNFILQLHLFVIFEHN